MSTRPVIFISAVSRELHTARDLIAKTLLALGYEPKWQDIAATDQGDLRAVLRKWIDDSDAVIQLVGHCYGFAPTSPDPHFGPCSYTQFEALYARQQGKKVYYIFTDPAHPTDGCACKPDPKPLHALQENYRKTVKSYGDLYHSTSSLTQTELIVRRLKDDLAHLRKRSQRHAALVLGLLFVLILGGVLMIQSQSESKHKLKEISQQNDKLLQAMRELPQTLTQQPRSEAKDDIDTRTARAYTILETQLQLPKGSLAIELPSFAQKLLYRAETSALDRASALFATQKFAAAEAAALQAKEKALTAAGPPVRDAVAALQLAGQSAQAQIHYPEAMEHYRAAAALLSPERDVLPWLDLQNAISWLYHLQGRYQEGLAHAQQVWQAAQLAGKSEASAFQHAHMYYAIALDDSGKATAAEPEYRAVIQAQNRLLGSEHPDILASRNNLASALESQGKYLEVEREYRAVLEVQEHIQGAEHPDTLMIQNNLAEVLRSQGKYDEAERDHQAVLKFRERVLGAEHPDTVASRLGLANVHFFQARNAEAEGGFRTVIGQLEHVIGAEHPSTLISRMNLANTLDAQGKHVEAEQEHRAVLKIQEHALGPEHPDTLATRMNLANTSYFQAKYAEAEQELMAVRRVQERVLGAEHPYTLMCRMNLAVTLNDQGKHAEAEHELREVLKLSELALGMEHPDTLMSRMNLAITLNDQGKNAEAEQEYRAVLKAQERVLGAEHPDVAKSCHNLALCLKAQQKMPEALVFMQRAEQVWLKVLGPVHPQTKCAKTGHGRIESTGKQSPQMLGLSLVLLLFLVLGCGWTMRIHGRRGQVT